MKKRTDPRVNLGGRRDRASMRGYLRRRQRQLANTPRDPFGAVEANARRDELARALAFVNASQKRNQKPGGFGR